WPRAHLAVDAHDPFRAQRFGGLERRAVGVRDHLGDPVMVAQIDEQHAAVVADAVTPAREPHLAADVACSERAAVVAAIVVHFCLYFAACGLGSERGKRMWGCLCQGEPAADPLEWRHGTKTTKRERQGRHG